MSELDRRRILAGGLSGLALPFLGGAANAQTFPSKTMTLVVPFVPGGSTDILARLLAVRMSESMGQSVVVENRAGAGGSIAAEGVARAAPDGHTLMMGHIGTLAVNPGLYPKLGYHPLTSFTPISLIAHVHNLLVVHPDVPVKTVAEFIAYAKKNPGQLAYATGGNGSAAHIATAALCDAAGIEMLHVPYRGTAPAVTDLLAGRVQVALTGAPVLLPQVQAGSLRALGVSGTKRLISAPDIPTIAEAALPGFEASQWYGIVVPAKTPDEIVARLNLEVRKAMGVPETITRLATEGADVAVNSPQEFRAFIEAEINRWGGLIKRANIRIE